MRRWVGFALLAGITMVAPDAVHAQSLPDAIMWGRAEAVRAAVEAGADIEEEYANGMRPLLLATAHGEPEVVSTLIELGAEVNARGSFTFEDEDADITPLMLASLKGSFDVVERLLDAGADVEARSTQGHTPLHFASMQGTAEVISILLDAGADLRARSGLVAWGDSALSALTYAALSGSASRVGRLLEAGADADATTSAGETPVTAGAESGAAEVLRLLFERGASHEVRRADGSTPLVLAAMGGYEHAVGLLLERGVDPNEAVEVGDNTLPDGSALAYAVAAGFTGVAERLLAAGADVNARNSAGETPLMWAAGGGASNAVGFLLERGASINATSRDGTTALSLAAEAGQGDVVRTLLRRGAAVNTIGDVGGALHFAALGGHVDILALLLENGAKVDAASPQAVTALMYGAVQGEVDVVEALLEAGADPNAVDATNYTPLAYAAASGELDVARALVRAGADPSTMVANGSTIPAVAKAEGHTEVANFLHELIDRPATEWALAGLDLGIMLPGEDDVPGLRLTEEVPGAWELDRSFEFDGSVGRLGGSRIAALYTAVFLADSPNHSSDSIRAIAQLPIEAIAESFMTGALLDPSAGAADVNIRPLETGSPDLGDASASWLFRVGTELFDLDVALLAVGVHRAFIMSVAVGPADRVSLEDLHSFTAPAIAGAESQRALLASTAPSPEVVDAGRRVVALQERLMRAEVRTEEFGAASREVLESRTTPEGVDWAAAAGLVCLFGTAWNRAEEVAASCDGAVEGGGTTSRAHLFRSLNRLLRGDRAGSLEDLDLFRRMSLEADLVERTSSWAERIDAGDHSPALAWISENLVQAATLQYQIGGSFGAVERLATRAVELDRANEYAYGNVGYALTRLGRLEEAEGWLRQGAEAAPESAIIQMDLAEVYRLTGRTVEAVEAARAALDTPAGEGVWHYVGLPEGGAIDSTESIPASLPLTDDVRKRAFLTLGLGLSLAVDDDLEAATGAVEEGLALSTARPVVCAAANQIDGILAQGEPSSETVVWLEFTRVKLVEGHSCPW